MSKDPNKDLEQRAQSKEYEARQVEATDPEKAAQLRQEAKDLRAQKS